MIVLHIDVEPGFRKADINSIPMVSSGMICAYLSKISSKNKQQSNAAHNLTQNADLRIDFVQIRKTAEICEARGVVFPADYGDKSEGHVHVAIKVDEKKEEIVEVVCEQCQKIEIDAADSCQHKMSFIFWLHRKSTDSETPAICNFWGSETETLVEDERTDALRIRDIIASDELRIEADMEASAVNELEGIRFLGAVLDSMDNQELDSTAFYQHCRPALNEFEPLFVHHTLLDSNNNGVKDVRTFYAHMEEVSKQGLFDRLTVVSKSCYKSHLWLESQYMRLRCSLVHRIATRKNTHDDEEILEMLLCKDRDNNAADRQQLKQHKRFILKQTEKLENKEYDECGLILCESYPYMCAAPDGITDDHLVEIKAPKTEEEFEKYLESRETIAPKYMAQIQIQMYMANVTKALYCVLSPTFDSTGALHYVWVQADMEFVAGLLSAVEDFWRDVVFPRLVKMYYLSS